MQQKFRILRIVAVIWKVLAWIVLVISVLGGCGVLAFSVMAGGNTGVRGADLGFGPMGGALGGVISAAVFIFGGVLYFVLLYAFSELIDVMLALEENTRLTAEQLKNITKA